MVELRITSGHRHLAVLAISFFILSCSKGFESFQAKSSSLGFQGTSGLQFPDSDRLDSDCQTSKSYDSCLLLKNPVAQRGKALSPASREEVARWLQFGVKLTDLDSSGLLKNSSIEVVTRSGALRVQLSNPLQRKPSSLQGHTYLEQLMSYYWGNRAIQYLASLPGGSVLKGAGLKVMVDDTVSGYRSETNTIHLSSKATAAGEPWQLPMALDASLLMHFLGQANAHLASAGLINQFANDVKHNICGSDPKGCCKTANGCSRALFSASGDYLATLMFSQNPAIGEGWVNELQGVPLCGRRRNLVDFADQSKAAAFELCGSRQRPGEVHAMGLLYASIVWELRKQAEAQGGPGAGRQVDALFMEHLKDLKGADDFLNGKAKLEAADMRLFGGQYQVRIRQHFQRRGFN